MLATFLEAVGLLHASIELHVKDGRLVSLYLTKKVDLKN